MGIDLDIFTKISLFKIDKGVYKYKFHKKKYIRYFLKMNINNKNGKVNVTKLIIWK